MSEPSALRPMFPREKGAYVQLGLALACGLVLGHGHLRAWSQAACTVAIFLGSGPALQLLGMNPDHPAAARMRARTLLGVLTAVALIAGVVAWKGSTEPSALLVPGALAGMLAGFALAERVHTAPGELTAAWALSSAAYPVAVLGGADCREAVLLASTLAGVHTLATVSVRCLLASAKGANRVAPRVLPPLLGLLLIGCGLAAGEPTAALAALPGTALAVVMLLHPAAFRSMRRLGWMLAASSALGILPLLWALR